MTGACRTEGTMGGKGSDISTGDLSQVDHPSRSLNGGMNCFSGPSALAGVRICRGPQWRLADRGSTSMHVLCLSVRQTPVFPLPPYFSSCNDRWKGNEKRAARGDTRKKCPRQKEQALQGSPPLKMVPTATPAVQKELRPTLPPAGKRKEAHSYK